MPPHVQPGSIDTPRSSADRPAHGRHSLDRHILGWEREAADLIHVLFELLLIVGVGLVLFLKFDWGWSGHKRAATGWVGP